MLTAMWQFITSNRHGVRASMQYSEGTGMQTLEHERALGGVCECVVNQVTPACILKSPRVLGCRSLGHRPSKAVCHSCRALPPLLVVNAPDEFPAGGRNNQTCSLVLSCLVGHILEPFVGSMRLHHHHKHHQERICVRFRQSKFRVQSPSSGAAVCLK